MRAAEPAAPVQDPAGDHPGGRPYLRAAGGGRGSAGEQRLRRHARASRSAWSGPAIPSTSTICAARSISRRWRRCWRCRASRSSSLQVGPRAADLKALARRRSPICRRSSTDFAETAAAVAALDLVITVDTSVAHLAGALGKPIWVLLPVGHRLALAARARGQSVVSDACGCSASIASAAVDRRDRARRGRAWRASRAASARG